MLEIKLYKILVLVILFLPVSALKAQDCDNYINRMSEQVEKQNLEEAKKLMKYFVMCKEDELGINHPIIKTLEMISWISSFEDEHAVCELKAGGYGIINKSLTNIRKLNYDYVGLTISDGTIVISENNKKGYINIKGQVIIPLQYFDAYVFSEGRALVCIDYNKCAYIDKEGNNITKFVYNNESSQFNQGIAQVKIEKKIGYINKEGEEITKIKYQELPYYAEFNEGLCEVCINYKCGYINKDGEEVIPLKYKTALAFSEGLASVENQEGKFGYINKNGEVIIPFKYDFSFGFKNGLARTQIYRGNYNYTKGYINRQGKEIIPIKYTEIGLFSEGFAFAKNIDGKYGYFDDKGIIKVQFIYDGASDFSEGLAKVSVRNSKGDLEGGFIDLNGIVKIPIHFKSAENFKNGISKVSYRSYNYFYINKDGECIKDCRSALYNYPKAKYYED